VPAPRSSRHLDQARETTVEQVVHDGCERFVIHARQHGPGEGTGECGACLGRGQPARAQVEEGSQGLQTFREFTERRLAPAMSTCASVSARVESLSQRVARATQLLSTRVAVSRERQNQQVLESMNRRAEAQLRLQQTVEGLSVAAITYYVVGLVGYAAKGLKALGWPVHTDLAMAFSIPLVALAERPKIASLDLAAGNQANNSIAQGLRAHPMADCGERPAEDRSHRFPSRR
jgi:hypothetical protein